MIEFVGSASTVLQVISTLVSPTLLFTTVGSHFFVLSVTPQFVVVSSVFEKGPPKGSCLYFALPGFPRVSQCPSVKSPVSKSPVSKHVYVVVSTACAAEAPSAIKVQDRRAVSSERPSTARRLIISYSFSLS